MSDFIQDIKKYDAAPNEVAVNAIAANLRLTMTNRDARYVSTSDSKEVELVCKNFAQKKLGADPESAAVAVSQAAKSMDGVKNKSRVTFYYLVAKNLEAFDQL